MKSALSIFHSLTKILAYGDRIRPTRDWLVILGVAVVLFCAGIVVHVLLFSALVNGKVIGSAPMPAQSTVESSVTAAQNVFQSRAAEATHYQNDYHFTDPSL